MLSMTKRWLLDDGARHRDGVVSGGSRTGFERARIRKALAELEIDGLIEANAHGDYYITEAGRRALDGESNHD